MVMAVSDMDAAVHSAAPLAELRSLVRQELEASVPPEQVLEKLEALRSRLPADEEAEEDVVLDVMDFVTGWCSPHMRLVDGAGPRKARGAQRAATGSRAPGRTRRRGSGDQALRRLQDSVDAAEAAAKELRKEMSRGSRQLLADVDRTLREARNNLRRVSKRVAKDLEDGQKAVGGRQATKRRSAARRRASRSKQSTRQ
jgi:hypothetical protein